MPNEKHTIKKLYCLIILTVKLFIYKISRQRIPFWNWLYGSMTRKDKYTFSEGCQIKYLFVDACNNSFNEGICNVYDSFRPGISDKELPAKDLILVFDAAIKEKRHEVVTRILQIIENKPDYFPSGFREEYKSTYENTFKK